MSIFDQAPGIYGGRRYHVYNDWVKREHGGRLQKVSLDAGFTCPNRDGSLDIGGCSFCNNDGFSPSYLRDEPNMLRQIETGLEFMRRRYPKAQRFLAYFQSYTNTYGALDKLKTVYAEALSHPDIVGLVIGTRPDCLPDDVLDYLAELAQTRIIELEIGIESCSDAVLTHCRRGHDLACTLDAIQRAATRGLFITGHLLLGLPGESTESLIAGACLLAQQPIDSLKFHQLQIVKHTRLAIAYQEDPASIPLLSPDDYLDRVIDMLEYLPEHIKVQRLGSEMPPPLLLSPDWGLRLYDFPPRFEARLVARNTWQGRLVNQTR